MNPVKDNPLLTRADMARACAALIEPLIPHMGEGCARVRLGDTGAVYSDSIAGMEAFSRALWGIVPLLAGKHPEAEPLWALWREGLQNGVNPDHPAYWGEIGPSDQRMVEMAVMGVAMCLVPERFLGDLTEAARANLVRWLGQINAHDMPTNNWVFFRVLVNVGFLLNGLPHSEERLRGDLALVEAHHEGDGWYFDYPSQRDYYTPWGYHYYGLVYAHAMRRRDPERCEAFMARARAYAPRFAAWFAADGAALPYGRSQTYRLAQGSFFGALALAGAASDAIGWGEMKGLLLRNLRDWLARPIFTGDGLLSIGYGYPNLTMAEGYNAPGSPYWAMKAFLPLALPAEHPFWTAEEAPYTPEALSAQPRAELLIARDEQNAHVQAFAAGNHAPGTEHADAKYEKFAYSTAFAFSVPRGVRTLEQGAFDSMLALSEDGKAWRTRFGSESFAVEPDRVESVWRPYPDVVVRTAIIPKGDWHLRIHDITTARPLMAAEGGYAVRREDGEACAIPEAQPSRAVARAPWGVSGILGLEGYQGAEVIVPVPNTNLLHPRTLLPTLRAEIPPGETRLVCAVLGAVNGGEEKWADPPTREDFDADMD